MSKQCIHGDDPRVCISCEMLAKKLSAAQPAMLYPEVHEYCKHGICLLCQRCPDCEESIAAAKAIKELPYLQPDAAQPTGEAGAERIHKHTRGGNDYISCDDCGQEWDYRKPGAEPLTCVSEVDAYIQRLRELKANPRTERAALNPQCNCSARDNPIYSHFHTCPLAALCTCSHEQSDHCHEQVGYAEGAVHPEIYQRIGPCTRCDCVAFTKKDHETLENQIQRLANFIMREIPGEPSLPEGAVDCAIRLLSRVALSGGSEGPGPRCPKCGKNTLELHSSNVFDVYVECHNDAEGCDFDLATNNLADFAQFFRPISESNGEPKGDHNG